MLVLTRKAADGTGPDIGSKVFVDRHLTITLVRSTSLGAVLEFRNSTGGRSKSSVPWGGSVRFPDKNLRVFALRQDGHGARLGFEAPETCNIVRDDIRHRRAA